MTYTLIESHLHLDTLFQQTLSGYIFATSEGENYIIAHCIHGNFRYNVSELATKGIHNTSYTIVN